MKKLVYGLTMMLALFLLPLAASAASGTQLQVNDKTIGLSAEPQISGETAYVDLAPVLDSLGYTVQKSVYGTGWTVSKDGSKIELVSGSSSFVVNGASVKAGATVIQGGNKLNLQAFADLTGRKLKVDGEKGLISLNDTLQTSVLETLYTGKLTSSAQAPKALAQDNQGYTGYIKIFYPNGKVFYDGYMVNSKFEGKGKYYDSNGVLRYDGNWKDNKFHGQGKSYYADKHLEYDGMWKAGLKQGYGTYYWAWEPCGEPPGSITGYNKYVGFFDKDEFDGVGKIDWADGSKFEGFFSKGQIKCAGVFYWTDGWKYVGMYKDGKRDGFGTEYNEKGTVIYEGGFRQNAADGYGRLYDANGNLLYEGEFVNGHPKGEATARTLTGFQAQSAQKSSEAQLQMHTQNQMEATFR
ncbi:stalk domain-containing protein [Paenibacillus chitinolyticus]|uniref:stalk domain-containing protein n=1 Tax=Paenibacillus chitinolyticus TaxID=79263 RepID=UPI003D026B5B